MMNDSRFGGLQMPKPGERDFTPKPASVRRAESPVDWAKNNPVPNHGSSGGGASSSYYPMTSPVNAGSMSAGGAGTSSSRFTGGVGGLKAVALERAGLGPGTKFLIGSALVAFGYAIYGRRR